MAAHQQPSPTAAALHAQHAAGAAPPNAPMNQAVFPHSVQLLRNGRETMLVEMGNLAEKVGDLDGAISAYERAIQINPYSVPALQQMAHILRCRDQYSSAVEFLKLVIKVESNNGEAWSNIGHCYLMLDDLQQAYAAYQQALYHLRDPKEPKLWYGIGILYDRYGSLEHAEEAFSEVMRMDANFEKANEIYFRLGIIYKQQQKFDSSLDCFKYIVTNPPTPLTEEDIWFQIGHVYEQQKNYESAKGAYRRVLERDPNHAKVLQQLGWLYHQQNSSSQSQEQAIEYLEKSVNSDGHDAQSWYLLGRCYMSQQKYPKAYEAYQQAVYRDGRNPTFWCSIGVLYYQINQYRDALDAYSRAIRLNPNISEVWYDLGTLYESCNNQTSDALDAYQRAADLDPTNVHIKARLALLRGQPQGGMSHQSGQAAPPPPPPQDVHPQAYQSAAIGPPGPQWGAPAPNQSQAPAPPVPPPNDPYRRPGDGPPAPAAPAAYDQRDGLPPHLQQRGRISPRAEPLRPFTGEAQRPGPPPHRGLSPSPKVPHASAPSGYPGGPLPPAPGQGPPPPSQQQQQQLPPHPQQPPNRIANPNYGSQAQSSPANGVMPPPPGLPAYGRQSPPPAEGRPYMGGDATSPSSRYGPSRDYGHQAGPRGGPPHPHGPDAAARDREMDAQRASGAGSVGPPPPSSSHGPPSGPPSQAPKRHWDEPESSQNKKPQNEETRAGLNDIRRPSPPDRNGSYMQGNAGSPESERIKREREGARLPEYHPSDAAHHPPPTHLPSLNQQGIGNSGNNAPSGGPSTLPPPPSQTHTPGPQQQSSMHSPLPPVAPPTSSTPSQQQSSTLPPMSTEQKADGDGRKDPYEPPARKMDVDENYDDDESEGDKKAQPVRPTSAKTSPKQQHANGVAPDSAAATAGSREGESAAA